MDFLSLLSLAASLSIDAMLVAMSFGMEQKGSKWGHGIQISIIFATAHVISTLIGYFLGITVLNFIQNLGEWIAFILLLLIGLNMLWEVKNKKDLKPNPKRWSLLFLMGLGFSLSGDNLTIGISLAFILIDIFLLMFFIVGVTFLLTLFGFLFGNKIGGRIEKSAKIIASLVIIGIAFTILLF